MSSERDTRDDPASRPGGGLALVGSLALAACGSDNNTGSASSSAATGSAASADCSTGTLNAEGSSAQKNAIEEAISSFQTTCADATVNYNPTGSGAGIKQFIAGQVDFAGSDSALKTEEKDGVVEADAAAKTCGNPAWNLPMVTGPIAIAYNVDGVDKLVLDARRRRQDLQRQDHHLERPGHRRAQPGRRRCRRTPIKVFFRSDESGTTENFTKYLKAAAPGRLDRPTRPRSGPARARARRSRPASPRA